MCQADFIYAVRDGFYQAFMVLASLVRLTPACGSMHIEAWNPPADICERSCSFALFERKGFGLIFVPVFL